MRQVDASIKGFPTRTVLRAVTLPMVASQWRPDLKFLVRVQSRSEYEQVTQLVSANINNIALLTTDKELFDAAVIPSVLEVDESIEAGDVLAVSTSREYAHILFRESDVHHTIFLTNRCNSNCLMCSQPPTPQDDSWLVDEAIQVAIHMRISPALVGFTGGEPLLLVEGLMDILNVFSHYHPETAIDLLTNGRLLSDRELASTIFADPPRNITWMVPLYGHADFLHDFVVQSPGAFEQTLDGLLTLQKFHQPIQLRIVLIEPVLKVLPQLCEFIAKNLPFVREVALIGCEPIGFALANRDVCEVDLKNWWKEIEVGIAWLNRSHIPILLMNAPLCALPFSLWPYAHQSISDWKQTFAPECESCAVRDRCSGLFAWYEKGWRPTVITALQEAVR